MVLFSSGDLFMHLCRHLRLARHLGVLMNRFRARMVHSSDLQGEAIIVGFQGPHNSSQVRDFVLLVEIAIIKCGSLLHKGVVVGLDLILHSRLHHQHHRVEVVAEFGQVEVIEFLVVVLQLSRVGVEVPPRIEVDEEATAMLSSGDLRRRPLMLLLQVSSQYAIDLRLCFLIQVLPFLICLRILLLNLI